MPKPKLMAQLCKLSYLKKHDGSPDTEQILSEAKKLDPHFLSIKGYNVSGSQAILIEHKLFYTVVFRGSDEKSDWNNNFDFKMIHRLGKVHRGFWVVTRRISNYIIDDIEDIKKPLYITGHSLGGAMASVFCNILSAGNIHWHHCFTFGQPRVFGFETADKFNYEDQYKYNRYQNNNDIVCHAPPAIFGYKHVGTLKYIDSAGSVRSGVPFLDGLKGLIIGLSQAGIDFQEDHDINDYIEAL